MSELIIPDQKIICGGIFDLYVNGELVESKRNLVTNEGLSHILSVALDSGAQITSWYATAFKGNVTVAAGWTAANFDSNATEITASDVDESARQAWTSGGESSQQVDNYAAKAEYTVASATLDLYGVALASASAFGSTSGTLLAATNFGSVRSLVEDDVFGIGYRFILASS